jgi:hypothetical protein
MRSHNEAFGFLLALMLLVLLAHADVTDMGKDTDAQGN